MRTEKKFDPLFLEILRRIRRDHPEWPRRLARRDALKEFRKRDRPRVTPEVRKYLHETRKRGGLAARGKLDRKNLTPVEAGPEARAYLASIGRRGGLTGGRGKSEKKTQAARANGKLGGRPRKKAGSE